MSVNAHRDRSGLRVVPLLRRVLRQNIGNSLGFVVAMKTLSMRTLDLGMMPTLFHRWAGIAVDNFGDG